MLACHWLLCLVLTALQVLPSQAGTSAADHAVRLTVQPGDTLIGLANRQLEHPERWREVAIHNRLKNPNLIYPGATIRVPARLLKGSSLPLRASFVAGNVQYRSPEEQTWKPLRTDDQPPPGSSLRTDTGGTLELQVADRAQLFLHGGTTLTVGTARSTLLETFIDLFLQAGRIITKVKKSTGQEQRFHIRTPSAVSAVRGTEFRTALDTAQQTRSEVLAGSVRISAANHGVEMSAGEGTLVRRGEPPLPPRRLLPAPVIFNLHSTCNSLPATYLLSTDPPRRATRLFISTRDDSRNRVLEVLVPAGQTVQLANLPDDSYTIRSRSIDQDGIEGLDSPPLPLTIRVHPLPPVIQTPVPDSIQRGTTLDFRWLTVTDAAYYRLQLAVGTDFSQPYADQHSRVPEQRISGLPFGTVSYRVASIASDGYQGGWSDPVAVTLQPPPPHPESQPPEEKDGQLHFRWRQTGTGNRYHFQMAQDQDFVRIEVDRFTDQPWLSTTQPGQTGTHHVRISSIDSSGYEGSFSPPQSFQVRRRVPYGILGAVGLLGLILGLLL